jgi:chemotaxis protein MotB
MARKLRPPEEHTRHEAWAIPYGDLITLLLAFFVVMYALSSVNEGKYRVLSDSLYAAFRGAPRTMQPVQVGEKEVGPGADSRTGLPQQSAQGAGAAAGSPVKLGSETPRLGAGTRNDETPGPDASLAGVADQLDLAMADLVRNNVVTVRRSDRWIEVEIRTDLLFPSGSAQLGPNALSVIEQVAEVLAPLPNGVRVEGHTDDVPIRTAAFFSNWELSAARAGSVVRVLSGHGVAPGRLAVVGFGEQHPAQSNDNAQGRNANRRVVVVIMPIDPAHHNDPLEMLRAPPPASSGDAGSTPSRATAPGTPEPNATQQPAPLPEPVVPATAPPATTRAVPAHGTDHAT